MQRLPYADKLNRTMLYIPKALSVLSLYYERFLIQLLLVLLGLPILILCLSHFDRLQELSLLDQVTASSSFLKTEKQGHLLSFAKGRKSVELPIFFPKAISQSWKIQIDYTNSSNLYALRLQIPGYSNRGNSHLHQSRIVDPQSGSITFGLNDTEAQHLTLVMYGASKKEPIEVRVSSITVSERKFIDSNLFFIILMLGVSSSLVLIGIITGFCLQNLCAYDSRTSCLFLFLGVSVFSILLVLVLFILQSLSAQNYTIYLAIVTAFIMCGFAICCFKYGYDQQWKSFLKTIKVSVFIYLILTIIVAILVGCIDGIALQEYYWSLIGKHRMFNGHRAHDNAFQYLNAMAIAENKPFNYFYQAPHLSKHLSYGVEDRQALIGTILGAYRVIWGTLSAYAVNTYGFFVIIGSCFSLLIVFPLYALFRQYYSRYIVVLSIFLLFMTTFVLGNIYYTWFKVLGGGFILAGVYFLHFYKESLKSWLIAGFFWGLAVNMHSGQAIIYPVLAIYFFYQHTSKCPSSTVLKSLAFTATLTLAVVLAMLPWELIKHYYFPNTNELMRVHFLHGEKYAGSTLQTLSNFFDRYTLAEQASLRSQQLLDALRFNDLYKWYANLNKWPIEYYLLSWNRLQFRYITIMVYPLLILLTIAIIAKKSIRHAWTETPSADGFRGQLNQLFTLSVACVIWGLVIMFTRFEAISSSFVSQFATLFILMFLHCFIAAYSRVGLILILFYCLISFSKLYIYFSKIIDFSSLL